MSNNGHTGEIYREFPGWIKLILIRKVTDFAAIGKTEKNDPARFEEAFQGVPKYVQQYFERIARVANKK